MAELKAIEQRPDSIEVPLGKATVAIVQPSEYNGQRQIFVGQRGPRTGGYIKGGVAAITPEVLAAIKSFEPYLNGEDAGPVQAPKARRGRARKAD
jgi:hypothetical protein